MADFPFAIGVRVLSIVDYAPVTIGNGSNITFDYYGSPQPLPMFTMDMEGITAFTAAAAVTLPLIAINSAMDQGVTLPMLSESASVLTGGTTNSFQTPLALPLVSMDVEIFAGRALDGVMTLPLLSVVATDGLNAGLALPLLAESANVITGVVDNSALTLPLIGVAATVSHQQSTALFVLPLDSMQGLVLVGSLATVTESLPLLYQTASVAVGAKATVAETLPLLILVSSLAGEVILTATLTLPRMKMQTEMFSVFAETYKAYVMNVETDALTEYQAFGYNSFANINGRYFAASPKGIFELVGTDDNGVAIDATVILKNDNFDDSRMSRMIGAYISVDSSDDMHLGVTVNGNTYQYQVPANGERGLVSRRIDTVKGEKAVYWQVSVSNVGGADFSISSIEPLVKKLGRRI